MENRNSGAMMMGVGVGMVAGLAVGLAVGLLPDLARKQELF